MTIETEKFADLIYAAGGADAFETTNFASKEAVLYPLHKQPFVPQLGTGTLNVTGNKLPYTHKFEDLTTDFANNDVDAGL
jgi:hypothetical protein